MTQVNWLSMSAAVAITIGGFALVAAPAFGKDRPVVVTAPKADPDIPTRRVGYADLNLATLAGEKTLNHRVSTAVRQVCDEANSGITLSLATSDPLRACRTFAWDGARPQIDRAVQRARDIAMTGYSPISAVAITIATPH